MFVLCLTVYMDLGAAGHIRALFRHANVRTLLRGHTAQVLDIEVCIRLRFPRVPLSLHCSCWLNMMSILQYSGTKKGFGDDEARSSTMGLLSVGKDGQLIAWEIHVVHNADGTYVENIYAPQIPNQQKRSGASE